MSHFGVLGKNYFYEKDAILPAHNVEPGNRAAVCPSPKFFVTMRTRLGITHRNMNVIPGIYAYCEVANTLSRYEKDVIIMEVKIHLRTIRLIMRN